MARRTTKKTETSGADSFAAAFNKAAKEGGFPKFEDGSWYAYVTEGGWHEKDGKESGWLGFVLAEGENTGRKGRQYFQIVKEDGSYNTVAMNILSRNLATAGIFDEEIESKEHLEEILDSIKDSGPIPVVIMVKTKKGFTSIDITQHGEEVDRFPDFPESGEEDED